MVYHLIPKQFQTAPLHTNSFYSLQLPDEKALQAMIMILLAAGQVISKSTSPTFDNHIKALTFMRGAPSTTCNSS